MKLTQELDLYLRSRFTLIRIISYEEERVLDQLHSLCKQSDRALYCWDHADGFIPVTGITKAPPEAKEALSALEVIGK